MDPFEGTAYRMLELLGGGGTAEVFAVEHRRLSTKSAAKLLRSTVSSDKCTVERFRLAADALAKLEHENVVVLHAYDETPQGLPFIVMELLEGQTLEEVLDQQRAIPMGDALVFAIDLLHGLEAVHELGIVHGDLTPTNMFISSPRSGTRILKLLDVGAARVIRGASSDGPEPKASTLRYMSPEAAMGGSIDIRSDVFSAGAVLYRMLTGRGPYDEVLEKERQLDALVRAELPRPSQFLEKPLPRTLEALVMRALTKSPTDRYPSAGEFAQSLFEFAVPSTEQRRPPMPADTPSHAAISPGTRERQLQQEPSTPKVSVSPDLDRPPSVALNQMQDTQSITPVSNPGQFASPSMSDAMWKALVFVTLFLITTISIVV